MVAPRQNPLTTRLPSHPRLHPCPHPGRTQQARMQISCGLSGWWAQRAHNICKQKWVEMALNRDLPRRGFVPTGCRCYPIRETPLAAHEWIDSTEEEVLKSWVNNGVTWIYEWNRTAWTTLRGEWWHGHQLRHCKLGIIDNSLALSHKKA